ncbi:hypothetical protein JTB14_001853 [Gonioctena quinquepunctata]|nr:hypothetical protein JTB14_001853 [Gonioctena quinquepunctata]
MEVSLFVLQKWRRCIFGSILYHAGHRRNPFILHGVSFGTIQQKGGNNCWGRLCPLLKGIGYAHGPFRFFFASFTDLLPWTTCDNPWNTPNCRPFDFPSRNHTEFNRSEITMPGPSDARFASAASEYFNRAILELHQSSGLHDLGEIKWDIALCLLAVYVICYFSLWKGISTGITLPGSAEGIQYYLNPNFSAIGSAEVWVDAATQVFFSLGPGFGVLLAYASYNKYHNNVYKDAILTSVINSATSFIAGFVIFSVLGYMATLQVGPYKK